MLVFVVGLTTIALAVGTMLLYSTTNQVFAKHAFVEEQ
jgi:hypothetical protein